MSRTQHKRKTNGTISVALHSTGTSDAPRPEGSWLALVTVARHGTPRFGANVNADNEERPSRMQGLR